jgi:hypothetical protein
LIELREEFALTKEHVGSRWIPGGRRFTSEEIVFFAGKGAVALREALPRFDLLITGPHATAAIPEELRPFLDPGLTRRKQFDFSDVSTSAVGRRWAEIDERVLYVENPHPRLVLDPNRMPPGNLEAGLREAFRRVRSAGAGRTVDLDGVDAVRPVTFAFAPVLVEPRDTVGWRALLVTLRECAVRGAGLYVATRDAVLEALLRARREAGAAPTMLHVMSLHDTMGAQARHNGAIADERPLAERLPALVSLSNRGDPRGEALAGAAMGDRATMAPTELRRVAAAFCAAAGVVGAQAANYVALNRVYSGGWETIAAGERLRSWTDGRGRHRVGAYMAEFAREVLLDARSLAILRAPGMGWPAQDPAHVNHVARLLQAAYERLSAISS